MYVTPDIVTMGKPMGNGHPLGAVGRLEKLPTRSPTAFATYVVERAKDHGILLSTDGPLHNVLKIKPPLAFNLQDADRLLTTLDKILAEDPAHV